MQGKARTIGDKYRQTTDLDGGAVLELEGDVAVLLLVVELAQQVRQKALPLQVQVLVQVVQVQVVWVQMVQVVQVKVVQVVQVQVVWVQMVQLPP